MNNWALDVTVLQNNHASQNKHQHNIISQLLACKVPTKATDGGFTRRCMSEEEILAHCTASLGEAFETVSSAIAFVLYELAVHPDIQQKVYEEIQETCNDKVHYFDRVKRKRAVQQVRRYRSFWAKYHVGNRSPFIHSVVSNLSLSGHLRPRSDCVDA